MKTYTSMALAVLAAVDCAPLGAEPVREIVAPGHIASVVRIRDLQGDIGQLRGTLVNLSDDEVRDVRLLVRNMFLWERETRPGTDDPSQAEEFAVPGPIPPRGSVTFTAPRAPLPVRPDGSFTTQVEVTSITRQPLGPEPATQRAVPLDTTTP